MSCVLDGLLRFTRPAGTLPLATSRRLTDAQVLTPALVAVRLFGGNLAVAKHYMERHWGQSQLDKSGFTRRLHALTDAFYTLFATVGNVLKQVHDQGRYVLDSFPWPRATTCVFRAVGS